MMQGGAHQGAYLRLERAASPGTPQRGGAADPDEDGCTCRSCFRLLLDCFKGSDAGREEGR
jgi:hypothetical protein